jgi:hypothetical protein
VCEQFNEHRDGENDKCHFANDHFVPAVDAVEVVRCKDCKHGEIDDPDFPDQYYCHEGCGWNNEDFFCCYGERREEKC